MRCPPLVTPPTSREAPAELVQALRETDPTADMLYLGDGSWVVGRVRRHTPRQEAALNILRSGMKDALAGRVDEAAWTKRLRYARAVREGFAPFALYQFERGPDARVVREFREAVWRERQDPDGRKLADWIEGDARERREAGRRDLRDPARAREADRVLRRPHSVISPGLPAQKAT